MVKYLGSINEFVDRLILIDPQYLEIENTHLIIDVTLDKYYFFSEYLIRKNKKINKSLIALSESYILNNFNDVEDFKLFINGKLNTFNEQSATDIFNKIKWQPITQSFKNDELCCLFVYNKYKEYINKFDYNKDFFDVKLDYINDINGLYDNTTKIMSMNSKTISGFLENFGGFCLDEDPSVPNIQVINYENLHQCIKIELL